MTMMPRPPGTIDHIGIAVSSLESALRFWRDALGLAAGAPEEVPSEGVRVVFLPMGESRLELLEALSPESPIARFIDKRGEGIHHICFRVTDLETAIPVTFEGVLPDLFREGQGVVVEGTLGADGVFTANEVLAKHDENYMPPEVAEAIKQSGHWQGEEGAATE